MRDQIDGGYTPKRRCTHPKRQLRRTRAAERAVAYAAMTPAERLESKRRTRDRLSGR